MPEEAKAPGTPETAPAPPKPELKDEIVETEHSVVINGQTIAYTATAGRMVMKDEEGKPKATIFFIAYTRENVRRYQPAPADLLLQRRPRLVVGLAAPGRARPAAACPLRRCRQPAAAALPAGRQRLLAARRDRPGLHRPGQHRLQPPGRGEKAKQFHGFKKDIESVGDFIRLYTTRYERWLSPKFLIGESYGTTRAAGLSGYLQERHGMYLNGIMLVSVVLNFQTLEFDARQRPALRPLPADLRRHGLVSQAAGARPAGGPAPARSRRSRPSPRRVHARALEG